MVRLDSLRLNINDEYKLSMGVFNVADQLWNQYRFDHWLRKFKWWWTISLWGIHVLMTNGYFFYAAYMARDGFEKKDMLTHYDFHNHILLAWLESQKNGPQDIDARSATVLLTWDPPPRKIRPESVISSDFSSKSSINKIYTGHSTRLNHKFSSICIKFFVLASMMIASNQLEH